jgi:hypothetical protein
MVPAMALRPTFVFLTPVAFVLACGATGPAATSVVLGDFRTTHVADAFPLGPEVPASAIAAYIARIAPERDDPGLPDALLAEKLAAVSGCLGIDAGVFVGLVRQESAFAAGAVSRTDAVGLTQMTTIGIREVDDQLGARGPEEARTDAIRYFTGRIAGCVAPRLGVAGQDPLWRRHPGGLVAERDALRSDADDALIYGAVLLKTDLAVSDAMAAGEGAALYGAALERYNVDPIAAVREDYRRRILADAAVLWQSAAEAP